MLDLPKSTAFGRIIPKDRLYKNGGANREVQEIFAGQVERVRWQNKISPDTMNIGIGTAVTEIEVVEVIQSVETLDHRILPLIAKAIPYKLLFVLSYKGGMSYSVCYNSTTYTGNAAPRLLGNNLEAVWENFVRQVAGFAEDGTALAEQAESAQLHEKLQRRIEQLERQARTEKQPRRKFDLVQEANALKMALKGLST